MKGYVFPFHYRTKTDLEFICMLETQNQNFGDNLSFRNDNKSYLGLWKACFN